MSRKTIVVTGANKGIGMEICKQLAKLDHDVVLTARNRNKGLQAVNEIGSNVSFVELDVSNKESIEKFADRMKKRSDSIDVLINNAGIGVGKAGLSDANVSEIKEIMETNFYGPMQLNALLLPLLLKSAEGRIINMSSGMGAYDDLEGGYAGYRLSKAGLNAQTILLANEIKGTGVKVNAMCPGWVRTDMGGAEADRPVSKGAETAVWLATVKKIPNAKFLRDKKVIPW
ncbi:MAG: SDR family NAD(P)-dependent oxidoreductase [Bacteroidia bacterium]|nr:SDR family NAD(P)-dependent oxidoreductase [Bacteroidia bacterium]